MKIVVDATNWRVSVSIRRDRGGGATKWMEDAERMRFVARSMENRVLSKEFCCVAGRCLPSGALAKTTPGGTLKPQTITAGTINTRNAAELLREITFASQAINIGDSLGQLVVILLPSQVATRLIAVTHCNVVTHLNVVTA